MLTIYIIVYSSSRYIFDNGSVVDLKILLTKCKRLAEMNKYSLEHLFFPNIHRPAPVVSVIDTSIPSSMKNELLKTIE